MATKPEGGGVKALVAGLLQQEFFVASLSKGPKHECLNRMYKLFRHALVNDYPIVTFIGSISPAG